jgi:hypothetical protein
LIESARAVSNEPAALSVVLFLLPHAVIVTSAAAAIDPSSRVFIVPPVQSAGDYQPRRRRKQHATGPTNAGTVGHAGESSAEQLAISAERVSRL